jgi:aminoglycoside 6'-N-acetyltransferase I
MMILRATLYELNDAVELALKLWPHGSEASFIAEFTDIISDQGSAVFLAADGERKIGFAQVGMRHDYVEGTDSRPVGYLEGIFVEEEFRGRGIAAKLLVACEAWVKENGCTELASDCELDNETSLAFHLKEGFVETNRIICFTKKLSG